MKKLLKNKRLISGLVALMLGAAILVMSLSLAWFYDSAEDQAEGVITIGSLKVVTGLLDKFGECRRDTYPETEFYHDKVGMVGKLGSIDAMIRVKVDTVDEAGKPIEWPTAIPPVVFNFRENGMITGDWVFTPGFPPTPPSWEEVRRTWPLGTWIYTDGVGGDWMYFIQWYIGADGEYYVEIQGNCDHVDFDGWHNGPGPYINPELHFGYDIDFPQEFNCINDPYNDLLEPHSFWVKVFADGVQAFPEAARADYFNTFIDTAVVPEIELEVAPYATAGQLISWNNDKNCEWFTALNDWHIEVDMTTNMITDSSYRDSIIGEDFWRHVDGIGNGGFWVKPDGTTITPFSSGPDLVRIAKQIQQLKDGQTKFELARKYGITIG